MGANPTQALGIVFFFLAFTSLAGAFAGGGILFIAGFVVFIVVSAYFFVKCKPWEHRGEENGGAALKSVQAGGTK